jgi:hypothetical protein
MASPSKKRKREALDTSESVPFRLADQPVSQLGPVLGKYLAKKALLTRRRKKEKRDLTIHITSQSVFLPLNPRDLHLSNAIYRRSLRMKRKQGKNS